MARYREKKNIEGMIAAIEKLAVERGMSDGDFREVMVHLYYNLKRQLMAEC